MPTERPISTVFTSGGQRGFSNFSLTAGALARGWANASLLPEVRTPYATGWFWVILPGAAFLILLVVLPLLTILSKSLFDPDFTTTHFEAIAGVPAYSLVLVNTFRIAVMVTIGALLLGYPFAYALVRAKGWVSALMLIALLLPLWTSDLVRAFSWVVLLGRQGPVNDLLRGVGLVDRPATLLFGDGAVLVGSIHIMLPFMILPLYSVMRGIDTNLVTAAKGLGATPLRAFIYVFLPLSLPGVAAGALLVFILALGFYITPATLGGPGQTMIAQLIESVGRSTLNWGLASALAVLLLVTTGILLFIYSRLHRLRDRKEVDS